MASPRTLVGILLAAASAAGCAAEGGELLVIMNNAAPGADCTVEPAGTGDPVIGLGVVDTFGARAPMPTVTGYILTPTIMNIGDSQGGSLTNERTVLTEGARVRVIPSNGPTGMPILSPAELVVLEASASLSFTSLFTVPVYPDGGMTAAPFDVLPVAVIRKIGENLALLPAGVDQLAVVTVEVTIIGETLTGTNVESGTFRYPITVCNDCLTVVVGDCVGLPVREYASGGECSLFQDAPLECCTEGTLTRCPASVQAGCGDGSIDLPEECDDANTADLDGCSATCTIEPGFTCTGMPSVCT